jgi:ribosomal protein L37AE/L43A
MSKESKKRDRPGIQGPRCPFCGRGKSVRKIEDRLYYCDHCRKMFEQ